MKAETVVFPFLYPTINHFPIIHNATLAFCHFVTLDHCQWPLFCKHSSCDRDKIISFKDLTKLIYLFCLNDYFIQRSIRVDHLSLVDTIALDLQI